MVVVFLKTVSGETRSVEAPTTVVELRELVASIEGVSSSELRLSTFTHDLIDGEEVDLLENSTLLSNLRLQGGGKKRKKKTYTKPKKIKHKHKKVPLRALSYYKVNDDGTIERLRRECTEPTCGTGIFMAKHKGRQYCGKCGLTYIDEQ